MSRRMWIRQRETLESVTFFVLISFAKLENEKYSLLFDNILFERSSEISEKTVKSSYEKSFR